MKVLNLIEYIKHYLNPVIQDALVDPRPQREKDRDYVYGDDILLGKGPGNKRITKLPFPAYIQDGTSACGAHAAGHARRLLEGDITFPLGWYRTRSNYDGEGMFLSEVLRLAAYADTLPTPTGVPARLTETYANGLPLVDVFNNLRKEGYEYIQIKTYDADAVFNSVSNGNPTVVGFYCTVNEWVEEMVATDVVSLITAPVKHFVTCLPNSNHEKDGYEWVSIIESAPNKGFTLRHIRKDFLQKRMFLGGGFFRPLVVKKKKVTTIPSVATQYGERSASVISLQTFLTQVGLLNTEHVTGYYGNITSAAVLKWQLENLSGIPLLELKGYYWGPKSIKKANELYSK